MVKAHVTQVLVTKGYVVRTVVVPRGTKETNFIEEHMDMTGICATFTLSNVLVFGLSDLIFWFLDYILVYLFWSARTIFKFNKVN